MYKQEVTVSGFYLAATGIITLITTPILAWYLDPAEIGRYSYYQMLITVGAIFLGGGFAQYLIRTYAESDNPLSKARELISILLILTVATVPLLLVFVTYKLKSLSMAVIIVCASLLITLLEFASHLKRMDKHFSTSGLLKLTPKAFFLIIFFACGSTIEKTPDTLIILQLWILLGCIICFIPAVKLLPKILQKKEFIEIGISASRFGFPIMLTSIMLFATKAADRFILEYFNYNRELGIYSVGFMLASSVSFLVGIISSVSYPIFWRLKKDHERRQLINFAHPYLILFVITIIAFSGFGSVVARYCLPADYSSLEYFLPVMISVAAISTYNEFLSISILVSQKTQYLLIASFISVFISFTTSFYIVSLYGPQLIYFSALIYVSADLVIKFIIFKRLWFNIQFLKINYIWIFLIAMNVISAALRSTTLSLGLVVTSLIIITLCFGNNVLRKKIMHLHRDHREAYGFIK